MECLQADAVTELGEIWKLYSGNLSSTGVVFLGAALGRSILQTASSPAEDSKALLSAKMALFKNFSLTF